MAKHRTIVVFLAALASAAFAYLWTKGPPDPTPNPPGSFSFAVFGDAPYSWWEEVQYGLVLRDLDANELGFVVNVGDLFWRPCSDELYRRSRAWFDGLRHPVIYTPGDNEWTGCWEPGSGAFRPLERLKRIRQILFADPSRSLGERPLALESQAGFEPHAEFVENARWSHQGVAFATVHLAGSDNATAAFPGRTADDDEAVKRRTRAATAWLRETFVEAGRTGAAAVVIGFHANPGFEAPVDDPDRVVFEPFLTALEEETAQFPRSVLVVHGDGHDYLVDHPLVRRTTGRRLENFTRMQVPGSPEVGWVRVTVTPAAPDPFAFEERVVPRWKYW